MLQLFLYRCKNCNGLRKSFGQLTTKMKDEPELFDIVIGEVDCCVETDLCATSDTETNCKSELTSEDQRRFLILKKV